MRRSNDTALVVIGTIVGIMALGLLVAGAAVLVVGSFAGDDGYFDGPAVGLASDGYAVRTDRLSLGSNPGSWFPDEGAVRFRITVTPDAPDPEVFVGVAESADVDAWLDGVAHTRLLAVDDDGAAVDHRVAGDSEPVPPAQADIWVASVTGTAGTTLTWDRHFGDWEVVVANADGSDGVVARATGSMALRLAGQVGWSLVVAGGVLGVVAVVLLVTGLRSGSRDRLGPVDVTGNRQPPSRLGFHGSAREPSGQRDPVA